MDKKQRLEEVGKYIEKYYVPGYDEIEMDDEEVKNLFDRISAFLSSRKKHTEKPAGSKGEKDAAADAHDAAAAPEKTADGEPAPDKKAPAFDLSSAKIKKITRPMSEISVSSRRIDDLISQMDETFSQRLMRLIRERNITEAEVYKRAYVDRRHFSKIKKDDNYAPNKKTVLAFALALELSLDETRDLLRCAGYALSRSSKFDIIIVYFLQNHVYNMFDINDVLYEYDLPIFE